MYRVYDSLGNVIKSFPTYTSWNLNTLSAMELLIVIAAFALGALAAAYLGNEVGEYINNKLSNL